MLFTCGAPFSSLFTRATSALVAFGLRSTSTSTRERMSLAAPLVACTTGMNTPSTSVVTSTEASAAKLGTALRRIDLVASFKKKAGFMTPQSRTRTGVLTSSRAGFPFQSVAQLASVLIGRAVQARSLVADDPPATQFDHAAAHAVDHLVVVGGHDHGRAGAVDAVQQLHDPD